MPPPANLALGPSAEVAVLATQMTERSDWPSIDNGYRMDEQTFYATHVVRRAIALRPLRKSVPRGRVRPHGRALQVTGRTRGAGPPKTNTGLSAQLIRLGGVSAPGKRATG